jgi:hypothetical protein
MEEMRFYLGSERTVSHGDFLDRRALTIDQIQFHTYPLSQA